MLNAETVDPPLFGTNAQFPSEVMPPASGFVAVEAAAGESGVSAPVIGLYLN